MVGHECSIVLKGDEDRNRNGPVARKSDFSLRRGLFVTRSIDNIISRTGNTNPATRFSSPQVQCWIELLLFGVDILTCVFKTPSGAFRVFSD